MRAGVNAKLGGGNESTLIEHMKASVQPSTAAAAETQRAPQLAAAANLQSGYSGIGSGPSAAVPPADSAVISSSTTAQQTRENIERALRMNEATNNSGYATLQSLGKQREVIQNSLNTVDSTHQHLSDSRQVIRDIRMGVYKEWLIKGCVVAFLMLLIVVIIYSKFIRK
ncbi:Qa-SNARE protein [Leishmania donovani]|uniref:Qa-SNARE_protein_-_putative n=3 Tax=Leishmania donovani species complex TaxID=38574 RepID=A0A6L0WIG5_LEIIN|nr:putative Qa-SNARE protein [Leishmania infantum JPCM5]XP_003858513.1 Qa-SNARE protein, putative [Leishmania donovani]CAC9448906.1 Qa-SNARE_protein_-_putative [Leishmania infantum]AYU76241.1 Qa-SNARE protein, putative [Leishmania donovani]TPP45288.1 Snare region anchored in the vesicle membrane C-terminus family protein [Leishmania donovani]TPP52487.1 Snare region anchored in the vesicle membrane C-terminus family protein [Leishmania donovani]CAJ1986307.1 Qa-SNARE protein [Leishmania donovan|eukprot:XP_001463282.1 putative Qa-SNARE protein [Leishmania infantum JPCM5]